MKLSTVAIQKFREDKNLLNVLAAHFGKSESTIRRWVKDNHQMLTTEGGLQIIEKRTGLPRKKILSAK